MPMHLRMLMLYIASSVNWRQVKNWTRLRHGAELIEASHILRLKWLIAACSYIRSKLTRYQRYRQGSYQEAIDLYNQLLDTVELVGICARTILSEIH